MVVKNKVIPFFNYSGYIDLVLEKVLELRSQYKTIKKAKEHTMKILPQEPPSLVEKYLVGKECPLKKDVVANRRSRYSKPALPV